jgi:predicted branched-subunit amino acid permease
MLGPIPGVLAWGLVTGIAMVKSGLPVSACAVISLTAYAGSAQLATLPLLLAGAPWWLLVLTATVVNLRFTVYSAALLRDFGGARTGQRLTAGFLIGDVTFVRYLAHRDRQPNDPHLLPFYYGAASCNWLGWQVGSLIGIFAAGSIPSSWGLEIAGILALVAVLAPVLVTRPALLGALVAALVSVLARGLPLRLGILLAIAVGVAVALVASQHRRATQIAAP